MATGKAEGFSKVTRASLQIKDRSIMPPDRTLFDYHQLQVDGSVKVVTGSWDEYLRDVDMGVVVKKHAPINQDENIEKAMLITDVCPEGIPDKVYISDPMLPI